MVLDKICEKQAQKKQTASQTPFLPLFSLHQHTFQRPASVVKYGQKLQKTYAKTKLEETVDSKQIQRFICRSIAYAYTLKLIAWDLKAIQEAIIAQAKRASLGREVAQKDRTIKVSECYALYLEKKKKRKSRLRKKRGEEKRAEKQANSQLAQIEFLVGGVPSVE